MSCAPAWPRPAAEETPSPTRAGGEADPSHRPASSGTPAGGEAQRSGGWGKPRLADQVHASSPSGKPAKPICRKQDEPENYGSTACCQQRAPGQNGAESRRRKRKESTCSTGLSPGCDLAGGRSWPGPAVSPRYHCSRSNLPASAWAGGEGSRRAEAQERRETRDYKEFTDDAHPKKKKGLIMPFLDNEKDFFYHLQQIIVS